MISIRKLPIGKKIVLIVMLSAATALLIAAGEWFIYDRLQFRHDLEVSVGTLAGITADDSMAAVSFEDQRAAKDTLNALQSDPAIVRGCVYTLSRLLAEFHRTGEGLCPDTPGSDGVFYEGNYMTVVDPIRLNGGRRIGTLRLRATMESLDSRMWRDLANAGLAILLAAVVALVLSARLQRWISGPLLGLTRATEVVSETNDYSIRAQRTTDDELGNLVESVNVMLSQIQAHNIEREKLYENEKELRAVAEEANRLKDDFLRTLSHELRTPLTAIIGWSSMIKVGQVPEDKLRAGLESIQRNAYAQTRLIDDLLDVSRISTGKLSLEWSESDVRSIVEAAIDSVRFSADAKKIEITLDESGREASVTCDPPRLQQAIANILSNAVKFTDPGGRIDVRIQTDNVKTSIAVTDNGMGIKPEFLPFIFERFRQADSSSTRKYGGLGLGLSISRHIIEMHGGTIRASSRGLNQGSTFTIEIPRIEASRRSG